jgi:hypothetical protein
MMWVAYRRDEEAVRRLLADPDEIEELLASDDDVTSVDIDKAWHGVHWVLTGAAEPTDSPASQVVFGGEEFGDDLGYGPARLLSPAAVAAVAGMLADLDAASLRSRVDSDAMAAAGIYPRIWEEPDVFDTELAPAIALLTAFYAAAAAAGEHVVQTLC